MNSSQFLILSLFAFLTCGCVECFPEQKASLFLDLKHGFTIHTEEIASWESSSNRCNWEGITFDPKFGNIIGLNLSGHNITGSIDSDTLFCLTSLRTLNLSQTRFDRINISQSGFEKLKELRQLDLGWPDSHCHLLIWPGRSTDGFDLVKKIDIGTSSWESHYCCS